MDNTKTTKLPKQTHGQIQDSLDQEWATSQAHREVALGAHFKAMFKNVPAALEEEWLNYLMVDIPTERLTKDSAPSNSKETETSEPWKPFNNRQSQPTQNNGYNWFFTEGPAEETPAEIEDHLHWLLIGESYKSVMDSIVESIQNNRDIELDPSFAEFHPRLKPSSESKPTQNDRNNGQSCIKESICSNFKPDIESWGMAEPATSNASLPLPAATKIRPGALPELVAIMAGICLWAFACTVFRFFFFYDAKNQARRRQHLAVKAIEEQILLCERGEREQVKKALLKAVEAIDVTKEKAPLPFPIEWLVAKAKMVQPSCKAWGEKVGTKVKMQMELLNATIDRFFEIEGEKTADQETEPSKERTEEAGWEVVGEEEPEITPALAQKESRTRALKEQQKVSVKFWLQCALYSVVILVAAYFVSAFVQLKSLPPLYRVAVGNLVGAITALCLMKLFQRFGY